MNDATTPPVNNRPTIFLLEEDNNTQRVLKENLRSLGFRVLVAVDIEDAMEWISTGSIPADLLLVDLVRKSPEEALEIGRNLRDQARYEDHTPLVVMPEKFPPELEGTDANVGGNDWISYYGDAAQLHRLVEQLTLKNAV